jgi:hypothetical protein
MHRTLLAPLVYRWTRFRGVREIEEFIRRTSTCAVTQRQVLRDKLRSAAGTEYGRRYRFSAIAGPADFRAEVPIVDYETVAPYVERIMRGERDVLFPSSERLLMFAMTSGTTASPKYVPVTGAYFKELKKGNFIWGIHLVRDHPSVVRHSILHIVSPSREQETAAGVPCGAATGLVAESQRMIARLKYALPMAVFRIADYRVKYYCILRLALQRRISLVIAANPSTLVALGCCLEQNAGRLIKDLRDGTLSIEGDIEPGAKRALIARLRRSRSRAATLDRVLDRAGTLLPSDVWPELEVIGCWTGGTLTPYLDLVTRYWGSKPLRDPGLIASEGRMTIPLEDGDGGGVLDIGSHFFEFLPYGSEGSSVETQLAHELEVGKKYCLILTTSSGFFRYNISDVVQVTGRVGDTPVVKFLHKGSRISSLTGEKISEHQVVEAFKACERRLGFSVPQFTVCPGWEMPPFYLILLEERSDGLFSKREGKRLLTSIAERFDHELKVLNVEYRSKRDSGRLEMPSVRLVAEGSFERDKAAHIERSGGRMEQYKHPYLSPQLDYCTRFQLADPPTRLTSAERRP